MDRVNAFQNTNYRQYRYYSYRVTRKDITHITLIKISQKDLMDKVEDVDYSGTDSYG